MATLTGPEIERLACKGELLIEPFNREQLNPNSYNLRLSDQLLLYDIPDGQALDMKKDNPTYEIKIPPEGWILEPGVLYLGSTMEYTETPNHVPVIEGRSSIARLGICVHLTAGFGDIGFSGTWTLEITAVQRVRIYAGIPICQIAYTDTVGTRTKYEGKYQGQRGPQPSRVWRDFQPQDK